MCWTFLPYYSYLQNAEKARSLLLDLRPHRLHAFLPYKNKRGAATGFTQLLPLVFFILLNLILFVKGNFSVVDSRIRQFFSLDGN